MLSKLSEIDFHTAEVMLKKLVDVCAVDEDCTAVHTQSSHFAQQKGQ